MMTSSSINTTTKRNASIDSTKMVNSRCSLQEGVRMMVTPSMFMTGPSPTGAKDRAILNPPVIVQKAIGVTQPVVSTTKIMTSITSSNQPKITEPTADICNETNKLNKANGTSNWLEQRAISPTTRTLGRQQRIVEPSLTPATTPVPPTVASIASLNDDKKMNYKLTTSKKKLKSFEHPIEYGSPDTPMSKMNILSNPSQDLPDGMLSPTSVSHLEFPTPERLLPIGQLGKDGICALVEKVREALAVPDISQSRRESQTGIEVNFRKCNQISQMRLIYFLRIQQVHAPTTTCRTAASHRPDVSSSRSPLNHRQIAISCSTQPATSYDP